MPPRLTIHHSRRRGNTIQTHHQPRIALGTSTVRGSASTYADTCNVRPAGWPITAEDTGQALTQATQYPNPNPLANNIPH